MMMKSAPTVGLELIDNSGLSCNDLHGNKMFCELKQ